MTIAAILLAAGASRRMGQPKPLLAWGDETLIEFEYGQLAASLVDDIVIVCGNRMEYVRRTLGDAARHIVFNPRWPQGRSTSLAAGAAALLRRTVEEGAPRPDAIVIQNVDQPTRAAIIDRLIMEPLIPARLPQSLARLNCMFKRKRLLPRASRRRRRCSRRRLPGRLTLHATLTKPLLPRYRV